MLTLLPLLLVPFSFNPVAALAPQAEEPTLEQRLERLSEDLEKARIDAHVPGMSIAVIQGDRVVLARGFGLADVAASRPADAETIYAVGSTTKAFTAALVGMLVDEGRLDWDDPVSQYLPWFEWHVRSDDEGARCTLRDLLSHRHGFTRMGLLWSGGKVSRETILRTAAGAEPYDDFRRGFHYCNVGYLAAGVAAGAAADSTWDGLMRERILEPLGMKASTLDTAEARKDARLARGYRWSEADGAAEALRMAELYPIGPAGSLNSNVLDMARWVRLQLGGGELEDMRLVSESSLRETWTSQIQMGPGASYGMGWMLHEHRGRRLVEHGGNIDGFSAEVALLPDEDLGFVLLTNLDVAPLQQSSIGIVFDALLEDWPDEVAAAGSGAEVDYDELVGTYVANFATFRGEEFEVRRTEAGLALHIPSQQTFELKQPDEQGRWVFALTDSIAVTFERDAADRLVGLIVHQSGFRFEVPRKGVEIEPEVPLETLEKYTGTFVRVNGGKRVEITIQDGRLALIDRGQMLSFDTPDAGGRASLRARPEQGATFETDAEGRVGSFVFHGDDGDQRFTRLAEARDAALPTLEEVLALRAKHAFPVEGGTRITGKVRIPQSGLSGTLTIQVRGKDAFVNRMDFGEFGSVETSLLGGGAWRLTPLRGLETLKGIELEQALLDHPAATEGNWRDHFDSIEVVRNEDLEGRPTHVVSLRKGDLPPRTFWVDAETGDVLRARMISIDRTVRLPVTISYSDFADEGGFRRPRHVVLENAATGRTELEFETIETGLVLEDGVFRLAER